MDQFNQAPAPTQEEFDALSGSVDNYSTTETIVGTFNGVPLYRRLYPYTNVTMAKNTNVLLTGDLPTSFSNIKRIYGTIMSPNAFIASESAYVYFNIMPSGIYVRQLVTETASFTVYAVVEYTK